MPTTRDITDIIYHTNGDPWANATVKFERLNGTFTDEGQYPPDQVTPIVVTDVNGAFTARVWTDEEGLIPSRYRVTLPNDDVFRISVPVGDTPITLTELRLLDETPVPVLPTVVEAHEASPDPHPQYLTPAEGALAYTPLAHVSAPDPHPQYLLVGETDLIYAPLVHTHSFASLTSKPSSVAGYGIADVYTMPQIDTLLTGKSDVGHTHSFASLTAKPTSLVGYGITDAATASGLASEITNRTNADSLKANLAGGNTLSDAQVFGSTAIGQVPLTVKGFTGQTANLLEVRDVSNAILFDVSKAGSVDIVSGGSGLLIGADNNGNTRTDLTGKVARILMPHTTNAQTAHTLIFGNGSTINIGGGTGAGNAVTSIAFWTGSDSLQGAGTQRMTINSVGNVLINGFTAPTVGLTIKGAASQSGDLTQWQDSTNAVVMSVGSSGLLGIFQPDFANAISLKTTTAASTRSPNILFQDNQATPKKIYMRKEGNTLNVLDDGGQPVLTLSTTSAQPSTLTYGVIVSPQTAANIPLIVRGMTSQSGDLALWQDSAFATKANITAAGAIGVRAAFGSGASGLSVPWISGDTSYTAYFGSSNTGNNQYAVAAFSDSSSAIRAQTNTGASIFGITTDAATTTLTSLLTLAHRTSGTPAAGYGGYLQFLGNSNTTQDRSMGYVGTVWADPTDATRTSYMDLSTAQNGTVAARMRVDNYGVQIDAGSTTGNAWRRLQVAAKSYTDPGAQFYAILTQPLITLTADNAQQVNGVWSQVQSNNTAFNQTGNIQGGTFFATGRQLTGGTTSVLVGLSGRGETVAASTGNYTFIEGVVGTAAMAGSAGTAATLYGASFTASLSTGSGNVTDGSVTNAYGVVSGIQNTATNGGTIVSAHAFYASVPSGTGAITNIEGLRIANQGRAGITNAYGILVEAQSGASNITYALYTQGGQVRFDTGAVGTIGLVVRGAVSQSANLQEWQDSTAAVVASHNAAGWLNIGPAVVAAPLHVTLADAVTAAVSDVSIVEHRSSGTPAVGFGSAVRFRLQSDTTAGLNAASITAVWSVATHASRLSRLSFFANEQGTSREGMRIDGAVGGTNVGLFGSGGYGGGVGVLALANAVTLPSATPTGGGYMYVDAGALKWKGTSGTLTTMGPAEPHCPVCGRDYVLDWDNEKYGTLTLCMWCLTDGMTKGIISKKAA